MSHFCQGVVMQRPHWRCCTLPFALRVETSVAEPSALPWRRLCTWMAPGGMRNPDATNSSRALQRMSGLSGHTDTRYLARSMGADCWLLDCANPGRN